MKKIYKYSFDTNDRVQIPMPAGAQILALQTQDGRPCIWALVNIGDAGTNAVEEMQIRNFRVYGTGHPIFDTPGTYIGTLSTHGGPLSVPCV